MRLLVAIAHDTLYRLEGSDGLLVEIFIQLQERLSEWALDRSVKFTGAGTNENAYLLPRHQLFDGHLTAEDEARAVRREVLPHKLGFAELHDIAL